MGSATNFLMQAIKILNNERINEQELDMVYEFLITISGEELKNFNDTTTTVTFSNDLKMYVSTISRLIKIFEEKEKYEECSELKKKYDESMLILKNQ